MDKSVVKGLLIGGAAATAVGAFAGYQVIESRPAYAEVISVEPVMKAVSTPRRVCDDVTVTRQAPVKDPKRVTGAVTGAVIGGVIGNQIGSGDGKKLATVAGAAAGGYAGSKVQKRIQEGNTYQAVEERCRTVYDTTQMQEGYEVRYTLDGKEGTLRLDYDPGKRIPVEDGELVLRTKAEGAT